MHKFGSLIVGIFSFVGTFSIFFVALLILVSSTEVDFWHLTFVEKMKIKIMKNLLIANIGIANIGRKC